MAKANSCENISKYSRLLLLIRSLFQKPELLLKGGAGLILVTPHVFPLQLTRDSTKTGFMVQFASDTPVLSSSLPGVYCDPRKILGKRVTSGSGVLVMFGRYLPMNMDEYVVAKDCAIGSNIVVELS